MSLENTIVLSVVELIACYNAWLVLKKTYMYAPVFASATCLKLYVTYDFKPACLLMHQKKSNFCVRSLSRLGRAVILSMQHCVLLLPSVLGGVTCPWSELSLCAGKQDEGEKGFQAMTVIPLSNH